MAAWIVRGWWSIRGCSVDRPRATLVRVIRYPCAKEIGYSGVDGVLWLIMFGCVPYRVGVLSVLIFSRCDGAISAEPTDACIPAGVFDGLGALLVYNAMELLFLRPGSACVRRVGSCASRSRCLGHPSSEHASIPAGWDSGSNRARSLGCHWCLWSIPFDKAAVR